MTKKEREAQLKNGLESVQSQILFVADQLQHLQEAEKDYIKKLKDLQKEDLPEIYEGANEIKDF